MKEKISQVPRNIVRYWYIDGLAEITIGAMFVLLSLYLRRYQPSPEE